MTTNSKIQSQNSARAIAVLAGLAMAASFVSPAFAATVEVTLSDHGAQADMPTGLGMGMVDADMSKASMSISATPSTVQAGTVAFDVTNASKDLVHEMIVVPVEAGLTQLPYDKNNEDVDENTAGSLGEVEERSWRERHSDARSETRTIYPLLQRSWPLCRWYVDDADGDAEAATDTVTWSVNQLLVYAIESRGLAAWFNLSGPLRTEAVRSAFNRGPSPLR